MPPRIVNAFCILAVAGCNSDSARIRDLASPAPLTREQAFRELRGRGTRALPALKGCLVTRADERQFRGCVVLVKELGASIAVPVLVEEITGVKVGHPENAYLVAYRRYVYLALADLGSREAVPALEARLATNHVSEMEKRWVSWVLWQLTRKDHGPRAHPLLREGRVPPFPPCGDVIEELQGPLDTAIEGMRRLRAGGDRVVPCVIECMGTEGIGEPAYALCVSVAAELPRGGEILLGELKGRRARRSPEDLLYRKALYRTLGMGESLRGTAFSEAIPILKAMYDGDDWLTTTERGWIAWVLARLTSKPYPGAIEPESGRGPPAVVTRPSDRPGEQ